MFEKRLRILLRSLEYNLIKVHLSFGLLCASLVMPALHTAWLKQSCDNSDQADSVNESPTISGFHKTGRESVRTEAYFILRVVWLHAV